MTSATRASAPARSPNGESAAKGARTRARIKASVARLLKSKGPARLTMADVCEAADITVGGFYFHFKNYEEVIEELTREFVADLEAGLGAAMSGAAADALQAASVAAAALYAERPGVARAFLQLIRSDPGHAARWAKSYDAICDRLAGLLAADQGGARAAPWRLLAQATLQAMIAELTRVYIYRDQVESQAPARVAADIHALCARLLADGAPLAPPPPDLAGKAYESTPVSETRPKGRGAATRARIRAAFVALLETRSYGEIGVTDICAHAGVTVGGFYFHFKKKEDLIRQTVSDYSDHYWAAMHETLGLATPFERFWAAACVTVKGYSASPGLVRCVNELAWTDRAYVAEWSRHAAQWSARFYDRVAGSAADGAGGGDAARPEQAYAVTLFIDSLLARLFADRSPSLVACMGDDDDAVAWAVAQIWSRALLARPLEVADFPQK